MEKQNDITTELTTISPLLAALKKVNVFTVPTVYFSSLPLHLLNIVLADTGPRLSKLAGLPATVPEGYFDQVADAVMARIWEAESNDELQNSPELQKMRGVNVFETPSDYFQQLPAAMLSKCAVLPANAELTPGTSLLNSINREPLFEVPKGYFDQLAQDTLVKAAQHHSARVVPFNRKNRVLLYAAAAMMTGLLALGLYRYAGNNALDAVEISTASITEGIIEKGTSMDEVQFTNALAGLSGADIAHYLDQHGDISDLSTLKINLDENALPSEEQYLVDESTLDRYLKEIEQTTLNN